MKKTNYHVNPAVNKWEEEQRRLRMEKMIQRAKSTLPPEARGGSKTSGPKKPSPYTAENNATKLVRKRSTTGGQGTPSGAPVNVQELDNLIYNRVQEILGMPLMRRAAATRTASKGAGPQRSPPVGRGGRRPAWNEEWGAQAGSAPQNHDERHIGGVGSRSGASNAPYERSPPKSSGANPRPAPAHGGQSGTPTKPTRSPVPARIEVPAASGSSLSGGLQRGPSGRMQGAAEARVVLLPSPSPAGAASKGAAVRPPSSRYGAGAGAAAVEPAAASGHSLGHSMVAAIEALNPAAGSAREAATRIAQHQPGPGGRRIPGPPGSAAATAAPSAAAVGGAMGTSSSFRGSGEAAAARHLSSSASGLGAGGVGGRDASLMQSVTGTAGVSQGGSPGVGTSITSSSTRRPPLAPAPRASGRGVPQAGHVTVTATKDDGDEDAYADDDFEEYEGTDDEGAGQEAEAEEGGDDGDGGGDEGGADGAEPDIAMLRNSVNALNGLVQMKIQQELARSQQQPLEQHPYGDQQQQQQPHRQSSEAGGRVRPASAQRLAAGAAACADVLASLALVGSEEPEGHQHHHGQGQGDLANSSLGDGLRQSDLDYLDRLGAGNLHDGGEVALSTDERPFVIEPGAPAGTAKAWGDRQPWGATGGEPDSGATGLLKLRERQEREKQQQQQPQPLRESALSAGGQRVSQQRMSREGGSSCGGGGEPRQSGRGAAGGLPDEEDSVLLGETLTPRNRTGAATQMQAVGSALAALASSGQLNADDACDLRTQTDALFGSLVQLHNLMNGPRGAELCSSSPSGSPDGGGDGAKGFTPTGMSPAVSPSQSLRRPSHAAAPGGAQAGGGGSSPGKPTQVRLEPAGVPQGGEEGSQCRAGGGSHLQLTPKHQLIAEDVAWMAGLVHSLSRSLHVEKGEGELSGA